MIDRRAQYDWITIRHQMDQRFRLGPTKSKSYGVTLLRVVLVAAFVAGVFAPGINSSSAAPSASKVWRHISTRHIYGQDSRVTGLC